MSRAIAFLASLASLGVLMMSATVLAEPATGGSGASGASGAQGGNPADGVTVYVWDFTRRNAGKDAITSKFTHDFEVALMRHGKARYSVLERRDISRLIAQIDNQRAIDDILQISPESRTSLNARRATTVFFGVVFDDIASGQFSVTVTLQLFDGTKLLVEDVFMPRGRIQDAASRREAMTRLVEKLNQQSLQQLRARAAASLLKEGHRLLGVGRSKDACDRMERSYDLVPELDVLLDVASCYETNGRTATAWKTFREAARLAEKAGDPVLHARARRRAARLEPRLAHIVINVPGSGHIKQLRIFRNGQPVPGESLGKPAAVDPGRIEIRVIAPGYQAQSITIRAVAGQPTVVRLDLQPIPRKRSSRKIIGISLVGAGGISLTAGLGMGISAVKTWNKPFDSGDCDRDTLVCETMEGLEMTETARTRARVSDYLIGAGVVAVGTGLLLYLTASRSNARLDETQVVAVPWREGRGVSVMGRF